MEDYLDIVGDESGLTREEMNENFRRAMARAHREKIENDKIREEMKIPESGFYQPMQALIDIQEARIAKWKAKVSNLP